MPQWGQNFMVIRKAKHQAYQYTYIHHDKHKNVTKGKYYEAFQNFFRKLKIRSLTKKC